MDSSLEELLDLSIAHHGIAHSFTFPRSATLTDLNTAIQTSLSIPFSHQKLLISPKIGILSPPYSDPDLPLSSLVAKKIQLLAPLPSDILSLAQAAKSAAPRSRPVGFKLAKSTPNHDWRRIQDDAAYTFHAIIPLYHLPNPPRSVAYLERLRDDAGIRAVMRNHQFSVGVLTEMNPAEHTTHESRTLGLNRNAGEIIELRLRTDAYDGYRDYNVIRHTLCHELAHNVYGPHDRKFYDLMKEIEGEVARNDWKSGGRAVGNEEFYRPEEMEHVDGGGWVGGEFVLGGSKSGKKGMDQRELMARAAEERARKKDELDGGSGSGEGTRGQSGSTK